MWQSTFLPRGHITDIFFVSQLSANLVSAIHKLFFVRFEQQFFYNHMWSCRVVTYRKQKTKEYIKFLAQKVVAVALEIKVVVTYETVFETVWLRNKRIICEVVSYGRWSLTRSGRYERVDCINLLPTLICEAENPVFSAAFGSLKGSGLCLCWQRKQNIYCHEETHSHRRNL